MTVQKPMAVLAIGLATLALGSAALVYDRFEIRPWFARAQHDLWITLGAADFARPVWAKSAEIGFFGAAGAAALFLLLRTRIIGRPCLYWARW